MSALFKSLMISCRRGISTSAFRNKKMMDAFQINTGVALAELKACRDGCEDPWDMRPIKKTAGSRDNPNLIPSAFESRIVGCVCCEESTHINWMVLHRGEPQRCGCGCWFKLCYKEPLYQPPEPCEH